MTWDNGDSDKSALGDLLAEVIRFAAQEGDGSEPEIQAVVAKALRDPTTELRLKSLLIEEGVSRKLQREYLRIFDEWRRAATAQRNASS